MFGSVTYDVHEIIKKIKIKTLSMELPEYVVDFSRDNVTEHLSIVTKFWHTYGCCYSLHPREHVLELGVTSIVFETHINIYVYFGYPGQLMYANTKSRVSFNILSRI